MKKSVMGVTTLALLAMGLSACGANPAGGPAPGAAPGSGSEIILGATLCLTGIQAGLDEPVLRGAQLAVDEINANGGVLGKQLKLVNLDGKSDPVVVGNNAEQLITEGAAAIIAPADFDFGGPASRAAQAAGLVGISPGASSPLYGAATLGDKQFTLSMWNTTMGAAAAEYAFKERGLKNAYVVTDSFIDYTTSLSEYFIDSMEHQGGTIVGKDTYTQGDQNFSAQLQRLKATGGAADIIFVSSYMPDLGLIIRDIRAAGINTPIYGGDSYDDVELGKVLGAEFGNGVVYATHSYLSEEANPLMPAFLAQYKKAHGGDTPDTAFVANGYDTITVLAKAMEAAGSTDGAAVAAQMTTMKFDLLTGHLSWSAANGNEPQKEAAIVTLEKGVPAFLGWISPQWVPAA